MRVIVNFDLCESNALCVSEAPDVFVIDDDDVLVVLDDHPGEEQRTRLQAAARACPKQAIEIQE